MIENGWYIYTFLDDYYINVKTAVYHQTHFRHTSLLYGVDEEKQIFYAIGYTGNQKYEVFTISFDMFRNAITTEFDRENESYIKEDINKVEIDAFKINPGYIFDFNLKEIYVGISNYLDSCNPKNRDKQGYIYGINCEYSFINYILQSENDRLDPRFSRFFMEMKAPLFLSMAKQSITATRKWKFIYRLNSKPTDLSGVSVWKIRPGICSNGYSLCPWAWEKNSATRMEEREKSCFPGTRAAWCGIWKSAIPIPLNFI